MSTIHIETTLTKTFGGMMYTTNVSRTLKVNLKDLQFASGEMDEDNDELTLIPQNPDAMRGLYPAFPPDEWKYRYFTDVYMLRANGSGHVELVLELTGPGGTCVQRYFNDLSEGEYCYLTELYQRFFPGASIRPLAYFQKRTIRGALKKLRFFQKLSSTSQEDCEALCQMIYEKREDCLRRGCVADIDPDKVGDVIEQEALAGLMDRAHGRAARICTPELIRQIIGCFEVFLDEKGVILDNPEKMEAAPGEDPECIPNIFGSDYEGLRIAIEETLRG